MTIKITETDAGGVVVSQDGHLIGSTYSRGESIELLAELARVLGFTLVAPHPDEPESSTQASAWKVEPSSPGMPFSEDDPRRSGFNSVPCPLEEAQQVAGQARNSEIFLNLGSIVEAFRVAVENHGGPPAYIIDQGNGAYTVIV